jgi:hypothetical protein
MRRLGAVCLAIACASGCCATKRVWRAVADQPVQLAGASLARDGTLLLAMRYERETTWVLEADLGEPQAEWKNVDARRVRRLDAPLPPSELRIEPGIYALGTKDVARAYHMYTSDKSGGVSHTVWVYGVGYQVVVRCPAPVDWGRAGAYGAVVATPFTLALDIVTAPIHGLWILFTVGGHGNPWLPWCG